MRSDMAVSDLISLGALIISCFAFYSAKENRKEDFINKFKTDLQDIKLEIIRLQPKTKNESLTQEDYALLETFRDKLLYQCCEKQKKKYLSMKSLSLLDQLQENIEDHFGNILMGLNPQTHRDQAINEIKELIKTL